MASFMGATLCLDLHNKNELWLRVKRLCLSVPSHLGYYLSTPQIRINSLPIKTRHVFKIQICLKVLSINRQNKMHSNSHALTLAFTVGALKFILTLTLFTCAYYQWCSRSFSEISVEQRRHAKSPPDIRWRLVKFYYLISGGTPSDSDTLSLAISPII